MEGTKEGLRNSALARLRAGELALGVGVRVVPGVEIAKIMRASGYDWLFIDMEHGYFSLETTVQIAHAALDTGIATIVRVPTAEWGMASRALDGGASGILLPHVDTPEDARTAVHHLRFPPVGHRATLGGMPQYDYAHVSQKRVAQEVNAATLIAVMIESPLGVANAEAIAATPGVDVLFVGINDLAAEMGAGDIEDPKVVEAVRQVAEAAARQGKWSGVGGIGNEESMRRYIGMGMRFMHIGNDFGFMMAAAGERAARIRSAL